MTTSEFCFQANALVSDSENAPVTDERELEKKTQRSKSRRRVRRLLVEYRKNGNPILKEEICAEYLGLVRFYARKYAESGVDYEDLYQEGCLGLLAAFDRFDPSMGAEFITYASYFIKGYIREFYRTKAWPCSVPRSMRDLSFQIRLLANKLGREPSRQEVVEFCDIPPDKLDDAIAASRVWHPLCFHHVDVACDLNPRILAGVSSPDHELEDAPIRIDIESILRETLKPEEKAIVYMRYFEDLSQREIAERLGTHQMHVSRSLQKSAEKLEATLSDEKS